MTLDLSILGAITIPIWLLVGLGAPAALVAYAVIGGLTVRVMRWRDWANEGDMTAIILWPLFWAIGAFVLPFWFIKWFGEIVAGKDKAQWGTSPVEDALKLLLHREMIGGSTHDYACPECRHAYSPAFFVWHRNSPASLAGMVSELYAHCQNCHAGKCNRAVVERR